MRTKFLSVILFLSALIFVFSGCEQGSEEHIHSFSSQWSADKTYHWHQCIGCSETEGKEEHSWDSGVTIKEATEDENGKIMYTCLICKYTKTEDVNKKDHEHSFVITDTDEKYLKTPANCLNKAVYYYSCSCGERGEETFEFGEALSHNFENYKSDNNATCGADGTKTAKCSRCDATDTITDVGSKLPHTYSEQWDKDEDYHWHSAICEHTYEIKDKSLHAWDSGVITKEASETESGERTYTCTVCNKTKVEEIPTLSHIHTYSNEWSYDEEHHWHEMNCGHEDLEDVEPIIDLSEHSYDSITHLCVCGQKELVTLTFVDYNGQVLGTVKKEFGNSIVFADEMETPKRAGYNFVGWTNGEAIITSISATTSITLQASYNRICSVVFVSNNNIIDTQYVVEGGNAVSPENNPQKEGYIFIGWENYNNITSDRVVNAIYEPIQYIIAYLMPDGTSIGQPQNISYGSVVEAPEVELYWFNWNNYHMYMFTDWSFNGNHGWNYSDIETEVLLQYKADASKTPSVTITANYATEYNLPVVVIEEETSTNTTIKVNVSIILPSNLSCYVYAIDLQFSFGGNLSINNDTINTSTVIYDETTTSNYNNKTRSFNFLWTSNSSGVVFSQQQIIDTIEFSRPNSQVVIGGNNFVLVNTSSIIVAASEDADYNDLQKITPIVVYK